MTDQYTKDQEIELYDDVENEDEVVSSLEISAPAHATEKRGNQGCISDCNIYYPKLQG